ncbi:MAG: pseudaminic acid cytidylyltransferase [Epsilonproteobacteria bacterium]|nr:pseudaminic acid cytidylyltransferase [Campylobacterota bacterium]NPA56879.1 pseudaminic acid cytidylyltransferase [Campylobacterota bacterium]
MSICIIPARGGSKRIPRKNILPFHGKPLILYTIEVARESGLFQEIVVSTDSREIAEIAQEGGAQIHWRSGALADDHTSTMEVFEAVLGELSARERYSYGCMLYATAPFLKASYLRKGLERLQEEGACYSFAATEYDFPIWRSFGIERGRAQMFFPHYMEVRSQDLPPAYHDAGQFYWKRLSCTVPFHFNGAIPIVIPRYFVQDIDTPEDLKVAELTYEILKREGLL